MSDAKEINRFTDKELNSVFLAHENFGPRGAYLYFFGREAESTLAVESFIVRFYSEYNRRVKVAF